MPTRFNNAYRAAPLCILHSAFCISLALASAAQGGTLYIAPEADGTGDGSSWVSPMTFNQAMTAAASAVWGTVGCAQAGFLFS